MKKPANHGKELQCDSPNRQSVRLGVGALCVAAAAAACGGTTAPPASATPTPSTAASSPVLAPFASSAPAPSADAAKNPPPSETAPATSKPEPAATSSPSSTAETSQPSQSPAEALTAARVAFLIDYANSDPKNKAIAACEKDPRKDDSAAKAACMQKARSAFLPDVLVFQKDKKGHLTLTIYKRNESELKEVYIAPIAFADETPNSLKLKFKGGSSGQRPLFKNTSSPTLNMPNDYTIEIDDSEFGKLRYDAKIGLVGK
jgi:hypothetical protein